MEYSKKKSFWIGISIAIVAIIIIVVMFFIFHKKEITYKTLTATDGSFEISFPSNVTYQTSQKENNQFVVDLYSTKDEMFLYATKIAKSRQVDFYQVVNDDKENYLKDKQNIREDSRIVATSIQDYKAYEYRFVYTDSSYGKDFYCHVIWIETDSSLYILNFEVVDKNKEKFQDIFNNIKNSFKEL